MSVEEEKVLGMYFVERIVVGMGKRFGDGGVGWVGMVEGGDDMEKG